MGASAAAARPPPQEPSELPLLPCQTPRRRVRNRVVAESRDAASAAAAGGDTAASASAAVGSSTPGRGHGHKSEVFHVSCVDESLGVVNLFFSIVIMHPNPLAFLQSLNGYNLPEKPTLVKVTLNSQSHHEMLWRNPGRDEICSPHLPRQ